MTANIPTAALPNAEYTVYADESGDHSLTRIDVNYPVFVLAYCIVHHAANSALSAALSTLKLRHFGHDTVVLHEREIRKATGEFGFLNDRAKRGQFMNDVNALIAGTDFTAVAIAIEKHRHVATYRDNAQSPYDLGVKYGIERVYSELLARGQQGKRVSFVFECRGRKEDTELELQFRRYCDGDNHHAASMPFEIRFVPKVANIAGLQLADLIARPIGRHVLQPGQLNRAFEVIEPKIRRRNGRVDGYGLKVFP